MPNAITLLVYTYINNTSYFKRKNFKKNCLVLFVFSYTIEKMFLGSSKAPWHDLDIRGCANRKPTRVVYDTMNLQLSTKMICPSYQKKQGCYITSSDALEVPWRPQGIFYRDGNGLYLWEMNDEDNS